VDLLSIIRKLWRYKFLTLPVIVLTLFGAAYVVAVQKPVYEAHTSFALLSPPPPPNAEQIAADPSLGRIKTDNPYTRFGEQTVIIGVLASNMSGDRARRALVRAGADPRYVVAPSTEFGFSSPVVQITTMSWTPQEAIKSATLVDKAVTAELDRMQAAHGTDKRYRIKALRVESADGARLQASGKLRMLVGVFVMGGVLLFIVISVADAFATLRQEQRRGPAPLPADPFSANGHATPAEHDRSVHHDPGPADRWDSASVPTSARHAGDLQSRYKHSGSR
jgi:hypothetical protein